MRIAILTAAIPFAASPVRRLAAQLASALEQCGHAVLVVNLPLPAAPLPVEHVVAIRALRLPNVDRAIALDFPACAVAHRDKVVWLAADGAGSAHGCYLREAHAVYAASASSARQLNEESGVEADVLVPPAAGAAWRHVAEKLTA